jgi:imidazoleglycerol-phosphate dehydratase/histidinol-phosphatase
MKKILFIDRDGTLILEPPDFQIDALEKIEYYPKVFQYLARIASELDYELVMVSNQDGLGTDSFPEPDFWPAHNAILQAFRNEGIAFREILIDRSFPHENAPTRKPRTGLLTHYFNEGFDLSRSFVIGDRLTDVELAKNLGAKAIYLNNRPGHGAAETGAPSEALREAIALTTRSWADIYHFLRAQQGRSARVHRQTNETDVRVQLQLDGSGRYDNHTGIGFFDHMLDQLARHSGCDLEIAVQGDLHIDEHHTIEDTALALGEAFRLALGDKRGISRYGFAILPMDDCLAQVAIDFSGRPWLVWDADFHREKVGGMPTEMFFHFFKSFSDQAQCNLNLKAEGGNEHHKIEILFKAFARAIRMAAARIPGSQDLPTTKGKL